MTEPQKIGALIGGRKVPLERAPEFRRESSAGRAGRIVATVPGGDIEPVEALVKSLSEPFYVLYVLHTSRGEAPVGRYQSQDIGTEEALGFLRRFRTFLQQDGRFDLWIHAVRDKATVVWDRHNLLYCYGDLDAMERVLKGLGFGIGNPSIDFPHAHHYREEHDDSARALMSHFQWHFSELRPQDVQFP